jgi:hypothetical protein
MEPQDPLEKLIGLKLLWAISGFCGGVLALAIDKTISIGNAFFSAFSGLAIALFMTPIVTHALKFILEVPPNSEGGVGFVLGFIGLVVAKKFYRWVAVTEFPDLLKIFRK